MSINIKNAFCGYEPELFVGSFGFKGSKLNGVWQTAVRLESEHEVGLGLGVQSVLWSDAAVFSAFGEQRSNELMFSVTKYALGLIRDMCFDTPKDVVRAVFGDCLGYAKSITGMDVTETFVLNALVPLDFAVWSLFARENGISDFDRIYRSEYRASKLASIPLITYHTPAADVVRMAENGTAIFKIKLGSDPDGDGDPEKMLAWDKARALEIHKLISGIECPYTDCGHPVYYFDANGRYDTRERLGELLDFLGAKGILERTVLLEEPFDSACKLPVGDFPVCIAADESAHSLADVKERIALGYKAVTLKPIAKTLSVTVEMAEYALAHGVQCFCADLTVNPAMVEWNKRFAARIPPIKGMRIGILESNGAQNYRNWEKMLTYASLTDSSGDAVLSLDDSFYTGDGSIFDIHEHYRALTDKENKV